MIDLIKMPKSSPVSLDLLPFKLTPRPAEPVSLRGISYINCSLPSSNTKLLASSPFWKTEYTKHFKNFRIFLEMLLKTLVDRKSFLMCTCLIPVLHNNSMIAVGAPCLLHRLIIHAPTPLWLHSTPKTREKERRKKWIRVRWKKKKDEERSRCFALERADGVVGKKEAAVEKLFHLEMKGAVGEGVISKGNIITFSYLLPECCGEGQGRRGSTEKHLKVITIPKVHLCDDSSSFLPFVYLLEELSGVSHEPLGWDGPMWCTWADVVHLGPVCQGWFKRPHSSSLHSCT